MLKVQKGRTSIWHLGRVPLANSHLWGWESSDVISIPPSYVGLLTCCVSFQMVHINQTRNGMTSATLVKSNVQVVPCHNPKCVYIYIIFIKIRIFTIEVCRIKPWEQLHPSQLCHSPKPSMAAVFLVATLTLPPLHFIVGTLILAKDWKLLLTHTFSPIYK